MTENQRKVIEQLTTRFNIDPDQIKFLNPDRPDEPWLSAEALITIARQSGNFRTIEEEFSQYIQPLHQVVHIATVIDHEGRVYRRTGVATIGESVPGRGEPDEHALAASRALAAALRAAGFHPLRPGTVVQIDAVRRLAEATPPAPVSTDDSAQLRNIDLRQIHMLAQKKGLIRDLGGRKDMSGYRAWLMETFGVETAAALNETERASAINALRLLPDAA